MTRIQVNIPAGVSGKFEVAHYTDQTTDNQWQIYLQMKDESHSNYCVLIKVSCPALGDTICSTPTVRKAAESYGHKVDVMCRRTDIYERSPYVDKLLKYTDEDPEATIHVLGVLGDALKKLLRLLLNLVQDLCLIDLGRCCHRERSSSSLEGCCGGSR